jgi:hypothetical protein
MWPNLRDIKYIPSELLRIFWIENLNIKCPRRILAPFDGLKQIASVPVRIHRGQVSGFLKVEGLVALISEKVQLDIFEASIGLGKLESVARVCVHVAISQGCSAVGEEMHDLVYAFLVARQEVPEGSGILRIRLWVALLRVNKGRKLDPVSDEEDYKH